MTATAPDTDWFDPLPEWDWTYQVPEATPSRDYFTDHAWEERNSQDPFDPWPTEAMDADAAHVAELVECGDLEPYAVYGIPWRLNDE